MSDGTFLVEIKMEEDGFFLKDGQEDGRVQFR